MTMSINSLNRNMLRLTGMQSGFDTASIVKSLMAIDQLKVDKQYKEKTKLEWKDEAYRDVNLKLRSFREKFMSVLSPETNVFSSSAFNSFKTTLVTASDAVSVSANSQANAGGVTIDAITQLAASASVKSQNIFADKAQLDVALSDVGFANALTFEPAMELFTNGNGETEARWVDQIAFSLNGQAFTFNSNITLNELISTVNANKETGVTMGYSSLRKGFTFTSRTSGAESQINIVNLKGNAFDGPDAALGIVAGVYKGQNAQLSIDGIALEQTTNNFTIDGVSYTLRAASDTPITFTVERDVQPVLDKLTAFVDGYNELIAGIQGKLDEKIYRSYTPLTDDERSQLSDKEAEKWDEMSKSGLLRSDPYIGSLLSGMRNAFYEKVEGVGKSMMDIGFTTGSYIGGGKIVIDKEKLRAALENDPNEVMQIFTKSSASEDATARYRESGLLSRISESLTSYTSNMTNNVLATNQRSIEKASTRLEALGDWLAQNEDRYWAKFTAMETALSNLNSQTTWISSMLGQDNQ